jgi:hypothetical protein
MSAAHVGKVHAAARTSVGLAGELRRDRLMHACAGFVAQMGEHEALEDAVG